MPNKDKELREIKEELATVNKAFHELKVEKQSRNAKFWRNIAVVAIIAFVISNMLWLMYRMSLEKVTETTTTTETETYTINQDAEGTNNSIINGGDIVNGKAND